LEILESAYHDFMKTMATQLNLPIPEAAKKVAERYQISVEELWNYCDFKEGYKQLSQ
jgi:hypothetical protein